MNLASRIHRWGQRTPDKAALICTDRTWTYRDLSLAIDEAAAALTAYGVGHGDRVAIACMNRAEHLVVQFACAHLGAIMVSLNIRLSAAELRYCLEHSGSRVLITEPPFGDALGPLATVVGTLEHIIGLDDLASTSPAPAARYGDAPALMIYTSGTTGRPKGAVLSQHAIAANAVNSTVFHDLSSTDVVLSAAPLFHVGGLCIQTTPALLAGATVVLHERFDPARWLADVATYRPTLSVLVPAMMTAVMGYPAWDNADLSSLRSITTGSSIVPHPLIHAWHERGVPVCQVYGLTETGPIAVHQRPSDALTHVGSTGLEAALCELRIVGPDGSDVIDGEAGELLLRGANLFSGYWNDLGATAAAVDAEGWFRTGDIGVRADDGHLTILDRSKDMIISGGENIYPAELEQVLAECPDIVEATVVGRPDERWGESPTAVVVRRPGVDLSADHVLALFVERLARYKHPRHVVFVESLPRNVMGKVLKHEVRAGLTDRAER
jgi:fatty-acyl-CoA synthase